MNSIVKFEDQEIELLSVHGQPVMTCRQIDDALGMSTRNGTSTLFNRHETEFTPEMTQIIQQGQTRVRVFNREGAWLIGMFARTPKAAAFRKWVITALAEHVDGVAAADAAPALPVMDDLTTEKLAKEIADLQLGVCAVIKAKWFSELTAELEQARKTIKAQNETLRRIGAMLPAK